MYQLQQWELYTETIAAKKMKEVLGTIIQNYRHNEKDIIEDFLQKIKILLRKYDVAQKNGEKGKLKAIQFCFLHLSVLKGDFEIHIEAFDHNLYLNRCEVNEVWRANIIYDHYEEYVTFLIKKCVQNVKGFSYKEKQKLRKRAALDFHAMTIRIISEHVKQIVELDEFQKMDIEDQGVISFGEYMNDSQPLYIWGLKKE